LTNFATFPTLGYSEHWLAGPGEISKAFKNSNKSHLFTCYNVLHLTQQLHRQRQLQQQLISPMRNPLKNYKAQLEKLASGVLTCVCRKMLSTANCDIAIVKGIVRS